MNQDKQPLVIMAQQKTHIILDGPALRVKQNEKSDQIIPIRRITNITSYGNAKWETNALLACTEKGIDIHFCKQNGDIRAHLMSPMQNHQYSPINELIQNQIRGVKASDNFKQWMKNERQIQKNKMTKKLAKQHGIKAKHITNTLIDDLARKQLNSYSWKKLKHITYAQIKAEVSSNLWKDNINPSLPIFQLHQIDLVSYISAHIYQIIMPKIMTKLPKRKQPKEKIKLSVGLVIQLQQNENQKLQDLYNECILSIHHKLLEEKYGHQTP